MTAPIGGEGLRPVPVPAPPAVQQPLAEPGEVLLRGDPSAGGLDLEGVLADHTTVPSAGRGTPTRPGRLPAGPAGMIYSPAA